MGKCQWLLWLIQGTCGIVERPAVMCLEAPSERKSPQRPGHWLLKTHKRRSTFRFGGSKRVAQDWVSVSKASWRFSAFVAPLASNSASDRHCQTDSLDKHGSQAQPESRTAPASLPLRESPSGHGSFNGSMATIASRISSVLPRAVTMRLALSTMRRWPRPTKSCSTT